MTPKGKSRDNNKWGGPTTRAGAPASPRGGRLGPARRRRLPSSESSGSGSCRVVPAGSLGGLGLGLLDEGLAGGADELLLAADGETRARRARDEQRHAAPARAPDQGRVEDSERMVSGR
jgi:hypothetical protein